MIEQVPPLAHGERLSVEEFRRRYEASPHIKKAELIDGVVYLGSSEQIHGAFPMSSPVNDVRHGQPHFNLAGWLFTYRLATPGLIGGDNSSLRLGMGRSEVQPDLYLRLTPELGGRAETNEEGWLTGPPEFIAEISASQSAYDLHEKFEVYRLLGVREYLVWRTDDEAIDWFILRDGVYNPLLLPADGVLRSETFPGLWLNVPALLRDDPPALVATIQHGTQSPEHAAFLSRLQASRS